MVFDAHDREREFEVTQVINDMLSLEGEYQFPMVHEASAVFQGDTASCIVKPVAAGAQARTAVPQAYPPRRHDRRRLTVAGSS